MNRLVPAAVALCALAAASAHAKEMPSFFEGVRPLGMGGAFTAVADDENALFYNPAGLDKVKDWGTGIINPLVEASEDGYDLYKDIQDTDFDATSEVTQLIRDYMGDQLHARVALFPHFVMRRFAMGVLGQGSVNIEPRNMAFPEVDVDGFGSVSGHVGLGFGFWDGMLRVGAAGKYVKGYRLQQVYTVADIASDGFEDQVKDDLNDGVGWGLDAGVMFTAPVLFKPTVATVVQNIGDVDLGDAGEIPQQINLGLSLSHEFWGMALTGAVDWVDVTADVGTDEDKYKRLHAGLELKLPWVLSLRGGLYQGYGSYGVTLDLWAIKVAYASYAEEIGSAAGVRADRRHVVQATLGW